MKTFKPILFSTPMVQSILEGRKTITRRVISFDNFQVDADSFEKTTSQYFSFIKNGEFVAGRVPKWNISDILWVRETFHNIHDSDTDKFLRFGYKADNDYKGAKCKPSIFMPKEACRIFLKVKAIRLERLQDISTADIKSEGVVHPGHFVLGVSNNALSFLPSDRNLNTNPPSEDEIYFALWAELWCKINGRDSWNKNPWVWVIEFEKIKKPNDFIVS